MQIGYTDRQGYDYSYSDNSSNYTNMYENNAFLQDISNAMSSYDDANDSYQDDDDDDDDDSRDSSSPYTDGASTYSLFVPQPVRFTPTEISQLNEKLMGDGISPTALNALRDMGNKPGGASVEDLLQAVRQAMKGGKVPLSGAELGALQDLSTKISPENPDALYNAIRHGNSIDAIDKLVASMNGKSIDMNKSEMNALLKALNIGDELSKGILQKFEGLSMTAKELEKLLAEAKSTLQGEADDYTKLQKSLETHLRPIHDDAKKREELARMGQLREQKEVAQSRIMIEDTVVTEAIGDNLNRTATENGDDIGNGDKKAGKDDIDKKKTGQDNVQGKNAAQSDIAKEMLKNSRLPQADKVIDERSDKGKLFNADDPEHIFDNKLGKDSLFTGDSGSKGQTFSDMNHNFMASHQSLGAESFQSVSTPVQGNRSFSHHIDQLRSQMENSVLTMMKNGTQRLEVMVNTVELGQMNVMLTLKNGEVSATIQTEKPESAALIAQQLERIRTELESQGFKVEKMDVQTGLNQDTGKNWQGMNGHNDQREMSEGQQYLEQLRAFRKLNTSEELGLARNMQNTENIVSRRAINAQQGLHIVA